LTRDDAVHDGLSPDDETALPLVRLVVPAVSVVVPLVTLTRSYRFRRYARMSTPGKDASSYGHLPRFNAVTSPKRAARTGAARRLAPRPPLDPLRLLPPPPRPRPAHPVRLCERVVGVGSNCGGEPADDVGVRQLDGAERSVLSSASTRVCVGETSRERRDSHGRHLRLWFMFAL
jgi:hypothetical protein